MGEWTEDVPEHWSLQVGEYIARAHPEQATGRAVWYVRQPIVFLSYNPPRTEVWTVAEGESADLLAAQRDAVRWIEQDIRENARRVA